ncbi:MAG: hypothetical protein ABI723_09850 [Bacteroidia bacterium]
MKYLINFSVAFFILYSLQSLAQPNPAALLQNFPKYEIVVDRFFETYQSPATEDQTISLRFARKPEGWFVEVLNMIEPKKLLQSKLYWSAKSENFLKLDFPLVKGEKSPQSYFNESTVYNYNRIAFYGYDGWDADVIKYFGDEKILSDTLLESLARAYGNYAIGFVTQQYDFNALTVEDLSKFTKEERFEKYIFNAEKEIETYNRLRKQNPSYETFVGGVNIKYANTVIAFFHELRYEHKEFLADKYFNETLYDDITTTFATNLLSSCKPDAVLFTNGDNDTYPLWYLQSKKNFRADVQVLNLSLLNLGRYIDFVKEQSKKTLPLATTLKSNQYSGDVRSYLRYNENKSVEKISLQDWMNSVASEEDSNTLESTVGTKVNTYPSIKITFQHHTDKQRYTGYDNFEFTDEMEFKLSDNYIYRSQMIILDMLSNNFDKRPFYYALTVAEDEYDYCILHIVREGFVYHIVPLKAKYADAPFINTDLMYDFMMNDFVFPQTLSNDENTRRLMLNNRISFGKLAEQLIIENKTEKANTVLDYCIKEMPDEKFAFDPYSIVLVENYFDAVNSEHAIQSRARLIDKAISAGNKMLKRAEQSFTITNNKSVLSNDEEKKNKLWMVVLYELKRLAVNNKCADFEKNIDKVIRFNKHGVKD